LHALNGRGGLTNLVAMAACLLLSSGGEDANAGCSNYFDGSMSGPVPKVIICFEGKCASAHKLYECQNVNGSQSAYETDAGVWEFSSNDESNSRRVQRNGVTLSARQVASLACIPNTQRGGNVWDCFRPVMKSEAEYQKSKKHQR